MRRTQVVKIVEYKFGYLYSSISWPHLIMWSATASYCIDITVYICFGEGSVSENLSKVL